MAAALSESFHSSIIVRQQIQKLEEERSHNYELSARASPVVAFKGKLPRAEKDLSLCSQLLLIPSLIGVELIATFGQIFEILALQFLEVPTHLVTVPGVLNGCISMLLIPILGWISDKGSHTLKLKMTMMALTLLQLLVGCACIAFCGYLKISSVNDVPRKLENTSDFSSMRDASTSEFFSSNANELSINVTASLNYTRIHLVPLALPPNYYHTFIFDYRYKIALAIIGFALLDIGFDAGLFLCRSFILACVPPAQQAHILVVANIMQSFFGTAFALLNTIKISDFLGSFFGVNGMAATVIFYSVFLATVETFTYCCTMTTGFLIVKRRQKSTSFPTNVKTQTLTPKSEGSNKSSVSMKTRNRTWKNFPFNEIHRHDKEAMDSQSPLINNAIGRQESYSATDAIFFSEDSVKFRERAQTMKKYDGLSMDMPAVHKPYTYKTVDSVPNVDGKSSEQRIPAHCGLDRSDSTVNSCDITPLSDQECSMHYSLNPSYSSPKDSTVLSSTMTQSSKKLESNKDIRTFPRGSQIPPPMKINSGGKTSIFSKQFLILYCTAFLASGAMCSVTVYASNTLTLGIYHGDPEALPGTKEYLNYEEGLRTGAWGIVSMYVAFGAGSLFTKKMFDLIGEKLLYTFAHLMLLASSIALFLIKTEEMYFLMMVSAGVQRVCTYVIQYVMALKFVAQQEQGEMNYNSSRNVDRVTAILGLGTPLHFILLSVLMGPLMAATGSPWVATVYNIVVVSATLLIFSLLFYVKRG